MRKSKAQIATFDLLIAITALILLFTVSIAMWNAGIEREKQKENIEELENTALTITDQLIKTSGLPEDWERGVAREYVADYYTVGLWHLNEGSGDILYDSSIYNNPGAIVDASWRSDSDCKFGSCLQFDEDDYVTIPHASQYNSQNLTIEFWMNPELITDGSERAIIHKDGQWRVKLLSDMRIDFYVAGVGNRQTSASVPSDEWTNLAFRIEKTEKVAISIFFDGEIVFHESGIAGTPSFSTNPIEVAKPPAGISYYEGEIDEIRISNTAKKILKTLDVVTLGLADENNVINREKVKMFVNLNYEEAKKLFGGYEFNFTLTNTTGSVITDEGKELKIGIFPDSENVVVVQRVVLYNDEIAFMNLVMWR